MPPATSVKKHLALIFIREQAFRYHRCLLIAKHLRSFFEIRFLHSDQHAHLVYQQGFDTFSGTSFSTGLPSSNIHHSTGIRELNLEMQFLEQVEVLETLQPALVIGDGITTLKMACEFTGISFISLLNGYQSSYFAREDVNGDFSYKQEGFRALRSKYGLIEKQTLQDELEGDLTWICDLQEFFPQKALPFHYKVIGPLIEMTPLSSLPPIHKLNAIKKTIFIDIEDIRVFQQLTVLNDPAYESYNLVAIANKTNSLLQKQVKPLHLLNTSQVYHKSDLVICNSERMIYQALHYGIPVLWLTSLKDHYPIIEALEYNCIGSSWNHLNNAVNCLHTIDYWLNNKPSETHRSIQYKVRTAQSELGYYLLKSVSLHFPWLLKSTASVF